MRKLGFVEWLEPSSVLPGEAETASPAVLRKPSVNHVSGMVVSAAIKLPSALEPVSWRVPMGLGRCEPRMRGLRAEDQVALPVVRDGVTIDLGYRMDLVRKDRVVVELKYAEEFSRVHYAQPLSCLQLSRKIMGDCPSTSMSPIFETESSA